MPSAGYEIQILENPEALGRRAAELFVHQAGEAVKTKGTFTVALAGGSTPKGLYSLLASKDSSFRTQIPWDKTHFFWGDERHVRPGHIDSNYRMVYEVLLSKAPVPPENVHRIRAENQDAGRVAEDYERSLHDFFQLAEGEMPGFDLVLLGMGADGHTASLFPGTALPLEQGRSVAALWVEKFKAYRISLTPASLNNAAYVTFLVSGSEKAEALRKVLQEDESSEILPARLIHPSDGRLLWLVDRAAASRLEPSG
ncbi:MAG: 6-phosphogluconolactonase [Nitrospinota bacterium]